MLSSDVQIKLLCSLFGCILRAIIATVGDTAASECLTVLLLDVTSALHDLTPDDRDTECQTQWHVVVDHLLAAVAKSEVQLCGDCDLSAVTKKLLQMQHIL